MEYPTKNISEYHEFYVQCDTLILTDILEYFRDVYFKTYKLDPINCFFFFF